VFGMLSDKDVEAAVAPLKSRIDHWFLCDLPGPRGLSAEALRQRLAAAGIVADKDHRIETFASPSQALAQARIEVAENDRIVVFGSFLTVSDVLATRERT